MFILTGYKNKTKMRKKYNKRINPVEKTNKLTIKE